MKEEAQRGQYRLVVGLDCYKWYQSQAPSDVSTRRLSPKGGGHEAVCLQGHWPPPHRSEKGRRSVSVGLDSNFERESLKRTIFASGTITSKGCYSFFPSPTDVESYNQSPFGAQRLTGTRSSLQSKWDLTIYPPSRLSVLASTPLSVSL